MTKVQKSSMWFRVSLSILGLFSSSLSHAGVVLQESGDLEGYLGSTHPIPSETSVDKYRLPTAAERAAFREALQAGLDGDLSLASDHALLANYDVISYTDTVTNDTFTMYREKNVSQHWGGLYLLDQTPERALVVQSPHPRFDGTRLGSSDFFIRTDAVAFLLAGTHRRNSLVESPCDGTLAGEPYRISDMAHSPDSLFQDAHEVIEAHFDRTVSLSYHGMGEDDDVSDVTVSNGTGNQFEGNSLSRSLVVRMNEILSNAGDTRFTRSHQEPGENPALSGGTNTQGRATNGSPDPCTLAAPMALFPERFIHVESDPDVRGGGDSNQDFMVQAFNEMIPLMTDSIPEQSIGQLVFSEIMVNPVQVFDSVGEYVELFNQTGEAIDLAGWSLVNRSLETVILSGVVEPGDVIVVGGAADLNGAASGGMPDSVWVPVPGESFAIYNAGTTLTLLNANGDFVASFAYSDSDLPAPGISLELAVGNGHPSGQTRPADYVASTSPFGTDWGSPGVRGNSTFEIPEISALFEPSLDQTSVLYRVSGFPGVNYRLWEDDGLDDWSAATLLETVVGSGNEFTFSFPVASESRFYRIGQFYLVPQ